MSFLKRHPLASGLGILVFLMIAAFAVRSSYVEYYCPMFHQVAHDEKALFRPWVFEYPSVDADGNVFTQDRRLNLLLCVVTPQRRVGSGLDRSPWWVVSAPATRDRAGVHLRPGDDRIVEIPRTENALIVIFPDGTRRQAPLKPGQAARIVEAIRYLYTTFEPSEKPIFSSIAEALEPADVEALALMRRCEETLRQLPAPSRQKSGG